MVYTLGLIGGSGLLKSSLSAFAPSALREVVVDTPAGRVFLRRGELPSGVRLVFVQRHDACASRAYAQPADINYAAVALALAAEGVDAVVGACSVGSLHAALPVGALLVPDDYFCPADLRRVHADYRGHFLPVLSAPLRAALIAALRGAGLHPQPHGVYVNSRGPRFETRAEVRAMASAGDVVGMTAAHEASACCELGLPYAMLALVDNYAHGVGGGEQLSLELFHAAQAANRATLEAALTAVLDKVPAAAITRAVDEAALPAPPPMAPSPAPVLAPSPVRSRAATSTAIITPAASWSLRARRWLC